MKVSDLRIAIQSGTTNTLFASWTFATNSDGSGGTPENGDIVTINSDATWYNGAAIDSWVFNNRWYIRELDGDRAVLDQSPDGNYSILSPISVSYLTKEGSTTSSANLDHLEHYTVKWEYNSGDGVWFDGSSSTTKSTTATYSPPANAVSVRVTVAPISKTYGEGKGKNKTKKQYWSEEDESAEYTVGDSPPNRPGSAPNVTIDQQYMLKAIVDNITDAKAESVQFELYNGDSRIDGANVAVVTARATFYRNVAPGGKYRVRYRTINYVAGAPVYSEWSPFSGESETAPDGVRGIRVDVESESTVSIQWYGDTTATSYVVEASTDERYFDSSSEVKSMTVTANSAYMTGLTKGKRWFFRVRSKNSHGESPWSYVVSTVIGTKPEPPTTWSLTSNAAVGDNVVLYWTHNTEDGSKMVGAEIEYIINGTKTNKVVTAEDTKSEREKIHKYKIPNSDYRTGGRIEWRIRTTGVTHEYSEWSIQRVITVYTPPTVEVRLGEGNKPNLIKNADTFSGDWINGSSFNSISDRYKGHSIVRTSTPNKGITQKIAVKANKTYLFSVYVKADKPATTNLVFKANVDSTTYTSDNSRLNVTDSWVLYSFSIRPTRDGFASPRIEKTNTSDSVFYICGMDFREQASGESGGDGTIRNYPIPFSITARPFTQKAITTHISVISRETYEVTTPTGDRRVVPADSEVYSRVFIMTDNSLYHELTPNEVTLVNNRSYILKVSVSMDSGLVAQAQQLLDVRWSSTSYLPDGFVEYDPNTMSCKIRPYCFDRRGRMPRDVTLSVLRINANGSLFSIGTGINNDGTAAIIDPHPTLDYARYRVVSTDKNTGLNEYSDLAAYPIHDPSIVLQWNEPWKPYSKGDIYRPANSWRGSIIKLPYNVDISEKYNVDAVLTEYIGRSNPVSYYGTQKGVSATWNTDIPKYDTELIYQLRRLANYSGDVYVREPNGLGYYANINISMNIKHKVLVVPVTIEVKKVESGEI